MGTVVTFVEIKEQNLPVRTGQIPYLPAWECAPAARGSSPCVLGAEDGVS